MDRNKNRPLNISENIHFGIYVRAIWEMLIGLTLGIIPIFVSFKVIDNSKFILFCFSILAFYGVYHVQNVYWRLVELQIDDEYLYIRRGSRTDKIKIIEIEKIRHYRLDTSFREHHIKIRFKRPTRFGEVIFIKPIKINTDSIIKEPLIKLYLESKMKKNLG